MQGNLHKTVLVDESIWTLGENSNRFQWSSITYSGGSGGSGFKEVVGALRTLRDKISAPV